MKAALIFPSANPTTKGPWSGQHMHVTAEGWTNLLQIAFLVSPQSSPIWRCRNMLKNIQQPKVLLCRLFCQHLNVETYPIYIDYVVSLSNCNLATIRRKLQSPNNITSFPIFWVRWLCWKFISSFTGIIKKNDDSISSTHCKLQIVWRPWQCRNFRCPILALQNILHIFKLHYDAMFDSVMQTIFLGQRHKSCFKNYSDDVTWIIHLWLLFVITTISY